MNVVASLSKWLKWVWLAVLIVNLTMLSGRTGDPLYVIGVFWLLLGTAGPAVAVSLVCGIVLLRQRESLSTSQRRTAWFLVFSPVFPIIFFYFANYVITFH